MTTGLLQEPGAAGSYDPETSLAGFDFSVADWPPFFGPDLQNWHRLLAVYHEWVHHYQYHATSYGYLYRIVSNAQLLMANGLVRLAREESGRRRVHLPLASHRKSLTESLDNPIDALACLVTLLQRQRSGILGYGPHLTMEDLADFRVAAAVCRERFGGPTTMVMEPTFLPQSPVVRYPVRHLLETHAHVLSALWLSQAVERSDGDPRVGRAALEQANAQFKGPYSAFADFIPELPGGPKSAKMFCALAEIALNPPGVHRHPLSAEDQLIVPLHTSWYPVVRLETLMGYTLQGLVPWPDDGWPEVAGRLLDSVRTALVDQGNLPSAFLAGEGGTVAGPVLAQVVDRTLAHAAVEDDVPRPLLAFQLDGLAKLLIAEELRQEVPLLLSGFLIEELVRLTTQLGGPSSICRDGTRARTMIGSCMGLQRLGLLSRETLIAGSDVIVSVGAPIAHALQLLVGNDRATLADRLDEPLLATSRWTLRSVLAEHYGMSLTDFD